MKILLALFGTRTNVAAVRVTHSKSFLITEISMHMCEHIDRLFDMMLGKRAPFPTPLYLEVATRCGIIRDELEAMQKPLEMDLGKSKDVEVDYLCCLRVSRKSLLIRIIARHAVSCGKGYKDEIYGFDIEKVPWFRLLE